MNLHPSVLDTIERNAQALALQLREGSDRVEFLAHQLEVATSSVASGLARLSAHAEVLAAHGRIVPIIPRSARATDGDAKAANTGDRRCPVHSPDYAPGWPTDAPCNCEAGGTRG